MGLAGEDAKFKNIKVDYSSDNDLNDAGDDLVYDSDFSTTSTTVCHDHNGKLADDGLLGVRQG